MFYDYDIRESEDKWNGCNISFSTGMSFVTIAFDSSFTVTITMCDMTRVNANGYFDWDMKKWKRIKKHIVKEKIYSKLFKIELSDWKEKREKMSKNFARVRIIGQLIVYNGAIQG